MQRNCNYKWFFHAHECKCPHIRMCLPNTAENNYQRIENLHVANVTK